MRAVLVAPLLAGFAMVSGFPFGAHGASAASVRRAEKYYGYWNYDQPDPTTLNNVAVLACPGGGGQCDPQLPLPWRIPQVGWVLFSPGPNGTVDGHTDQGCTWNFDVTSTGLELSSTTQQCFNRDIGSAYNITTWSVQVSGNEEREQMVSTSHQPNGVDLIDSMPSGSRTKVHGVGGENSVDRFVGAYAYDPAAFQTLTNVVIDPQNGTAQPEQGAVGITRSGHGAIVAHTPNGCDWTLAVRGNTAELDPATQTCHTANGDVSLRYWAIVTNDGEHLNAFRAGSNRLYGQPWTDDYLYVGALTRSPVFVRR